MFNLMGCGLRGLFDTHIRSCDGFVQKVDGIWQTMHSYLLRSQGRTPFPLDKTPSHIFGEVRILYFVRLTNLWLIAHCYFPHMTHSHWGTPIAIPSRWHFQNYFIYDSTEWHVFDWQILCGYCIHMTYSSNKNIESFMVQLHNGRALIEFCSAEQ